MPSQQDTPQTKRPPLGRTSSSSSTLGQSPSAGQSPSHRSSAYRPQRHVVGHAQGKSRVGPRNTSFGKNLNTLNKLAQAQGGGDGAADKGKNHRRSLSGSLTPGAASPRPGQMRRHVSTFAIPSRNSSHTNLKKNHSSGQLARQGSSKTMAKSPTATAIRRTSSHPGKTRVRSPPPKGHPTVHFDVCSDDDGGGDNEWTEESGSQSPVTTRSSTRNNSVILDKDKLLNGGERAEPSQNGKSSTVGLARSPPPLSSPRSEPAQRPSDRMSNHDRIANGDRPYHTGRTPDADAITSRLLQRASYAARPQMSSVSATVTSDANHRHSLSQSQNSALGDSTPGRDLVSRFISGEDSSTGTPRDSSFLPHHSPPQLQPQDFDAKKRNKSAPNFANRAISAGNSPSHSRTQSQKSGTSTPTELHPSRTQQKLWLQRASSVLEPQKSVPAILPRAGGPQQLLGPSVNYALGDGRIDPRMQRQFDEAQNEYKVVRRYRNPLVDAIKRINDTPDSLRRKNKPKQALKNGYHAGLDGQAHEARERERERKRAAAATATARQGSTGGDSRRSRVSFELPTPTKATSDREEQRRESFSTGPGADADAEGDDIEELCRRLWDHPEVEGND